MYLNFHSDDIMELNEELGRFDSPNFIFTPFNLGHMVQFNLTSAVFNNYGFEINSISSLGFRCGFMDGTNTSPHDAISLTLNIQESKCAVL